MAHHALQTWDYNDSDEAAIRRGRKAQLALGLLATLFFGTMLLADRGDFIAVLPWMLVVAAPLVHVWIRMRSAERPPRQD